MQRRTFLTLCTVSAPPLVTASDITPTASTTPGNAAAGRPVTWPATMAANGKASGMAIGMNLGWINTWGGAYPFANLVCNMDLWQRARGTGTYTQDQGLLEVSSSSDEFRAYVSDTGNGLPAGTYTVLNPSRCTVAIGDFGNPSRFAGWTDAAEFTFKYQPSLGFLGVWCRGGLHNRQGNLAIVKPGQLAAWRTGNPWCSDFLAFHRQLGTRVLRTMDWTSASSNLEAEWAHRASPAKPSLRTRSGHVVPWEFVLDLATRLAADPWICIPPRASADYVSQLARLIGLGLPPERRVHVETGNEIWNYADPWGEGSTWVQYLSHPRYTATVDNGPRGSYRLDNHGLFEGEKVRCFATLENLTVSQANWQTRIGWQTRVHLLDAHTFQLQEPGAAGPVTIGIAAGQRNLLFVRESDPGPTDLQANYARLSMRNWDLLAAGAGRARFVNVLGSMAATVGTTQARAAAPGVAAKADVVAIAPYFGGNYWAGRIDPGDTSLTPLAWVNAAGRSVHVGLYLPDNEPSATDVVSGKGAIAQTTLKANGSDQFVKGPAFTGLPNGAPYKLCFALVDHLGYVWLASQIVAPAAKGASVHVFDSHANQAFRNRRVTDTETGPAFTKHAASSAGLPIVAYEGGLHYHEGMPPPVKAWLNAYLASPEFAACITHNLNTAAARGAQLFCYYADVLGTPFSIARSYADTQDLRFRAISTFGGRVAARQRVAFNRTTLAPGLSAEPTAYPAIVHTFADRDWHYSLLEGNPQFDTTGGVIRLLHGRGIDWGTETPYRLRIEASDGYTQDVFMLQFKLGTLPQLPPGPVPAPVLTGRPPLLASWDFTDDSRVVESTPGLIDAVKGSDGTHITLTSSGEARLSRTTRGGKKVAQSDGNKRCMDVASDLGIGATGVTVVLIYEPLTIEHGRTLFEVGDAGATYVEARYFVDASVAKGYQFNKFDNSGGRSTAPSGNPLTHGVRMIVGSTANGSSSPASVATSSTAVSLSASTTARTPVIADKKTTLFANSTNGGRTGFADGYCWRILVYGTQLGTQQLNEVSKWAVFNFSII